MSITDNTNTINDMKAAIRTSQIITGDFIERLSKAHNNLVKTVRVYTGSIPTANNASTDSMRLNQHADSVDTAEAQDPTQVTQPASVSLVERLRSNLQRYDDVVVRHRLIWAVEGIQATESTENDALMSDVESNTEYCEESSSDLTDEEVLGKCAFPGWRESMQGLEYEATVSKVAIPYNFWHNMTGPDFEFLTYDSISLGADLFSREMREQIDLTKLKSDPLVGEYKHVVFPLPGKFVERIRYLQDIVSSEQREVDDINRTKCYLGRPAMNELIAKVRIEAAQAKVDLAAEFEAFNEAHRKRSIERRREAIRLINARARDPHSYDGIGAYEVVETTTSLRIIISENEDVKIDYNVFKDQLRVRSNRRIGRGGNAYYQVPLELLSDFIMAKYDEETGLLDGFKVSDRTVETDPDNVLRAKEKKKKREEEMRSKPEKQRKMDPAREIESSALQARSETREYLKMYEMSEEDARMNDRVEELVRLYHRQYADTLRQMLDTEDRDGFRNWLLERSVEHNESSVRELQINIDNVFDIEVKLAFMAEDSEYMKYLLSLDCARETMDLVKEVAAAREKIDMLTDAEKSLRAEKKYAKAKALRENIEQVKESLVTSARREYPRVLSTYLNYENQLLKKFVDNEELILFFISNEMDELEEKHTKTTEKLESDSEEEKPKKEKVVKKKPVVVEESDEESDDEESDDGVYKFTEEQLTKHLTLKANIRGVKTRKSKGTVGIQRTAPFKVEWGTYRDPLYAALMSDVFARTLGLPPVGREFNYPELSFTADQIDDPALHKAIKKYKEMV